MKFIPKQNIKGKKNWQYLKKQGRPLPSLSPNQTYFSMKKFYLYFLLVSIQKYSGKELRHMKQS